MNKPKIRIFYSKYIIYTDEFKLKLLRPHQGSLRFDFMLNRNCKIV